MIHINNTSRRRNKRPRTSSLQGTSQQGTPKRLRTLSPQGITKQDISKRLRITIPEAQGIIEHLSSILPPSATWQDFRAEHNTIRHNRRIFERDFPLYNEALNQPCRRPESKGRDYVPVYKSDCTVTPGQSTRESSLEAIDDKDLYGNTIQPVLFDPLTSTRSLRVPENTPEPESCRNKPTPS